MLLRRGHLTNNYYGIKNDKNAEYGLVLWRLKQEVESGDAWGFDSCLSTKEVLSNFDRNYYSADCYVSKKIDSKQTGEFYKETKFKNKINAEKWGENFKSGMVSIGKKGFNVELEPSKYGGFSAIEPAKFALIKKQQKSGFDYKFISIPNLVTCPTSVIKVDEYIRNTYPNYNVVKFISKYSILEEKTFGKAIISGKDDKYCANQLTFSRENKELYKFVYLVVKYMEVAQNKDKLVKYKKWINEKIYPILTKEQKENFDDLQKENFVYEYVIENIKRFKQEYVSHLKEKHILKNLADEFGQYFDEMLQDGADLEKMLAIIPELLKITQCNGSRVDLKKYSTENVVFNGEVGRITNAIQKWEDTYIWHTSITGIFSKKEKLIKK